MHINFSEYIWCSFNAPVELIFLQNKLLMRSHNACMSNSELDTLQSGPKIGTIFVHLKFTKYTYFQKNTIRIRRKFVIILPIKSQPHLKCFATLSCEISVCRSISLTMPLVSGVTGFSVSSSSKADTLNI